MSHRLRLDDYERVYLINLIEENTKMQGALISPSIRKLLKKLGDDKPIPSKARKVPKHQFQCSENECGKITRSSSGMYRHTKAAHNRDRTDTERIPLT
jgi:hypothetical protein